MSYLIIADWDDTNFHPTRTNTTKTEVEARALVSRLINDLPPNKRAPNAFYVDMPVEGINSNYITVDPSTKTITYDSSQERSDKTAKAFEQLREQRNNKLYDTDWVSNRAYDAGTEIPSDWKTYRQALRDLPANTPDPVSPTWPVAPV